jgi:hypothetical protein
MNLNPLKDFDAIRFQTLQVIVMVAILGVMLVLLGKNEK